MTVCSDVLTRCRRAEAVGWFHIGNRSQPVALCAGCLEFAKQWAVREAAPEPIRLPTWRERALEGLGRMKDLTGALAA